jgi:hypothetical protein
MTIPTFPPQISKSKFFDLKISSLPNHTVFSMQFYTPFFHTSNLPDTLHILQKFIPSIFECLCFNDGCLGFADEVKDTELGHLFEHILLEYLCKTKVNTAQIDAMYKGETKWNWDKENLGTFHITINAGFKDSYNLKVALKRTMHLMELILAPSYDLVEYNPISS